jgi:uncharacterized protein (DUF1501 family)
MSINRRQFMVGCSAAIAAMAGARVRALSFVPEGVAAGPSDVLVVVFLRGGMDGLGLLAPVDDPDYIAARPSVLRVTDAGEQAGLSLGTNLGGRDFRLHKSASPLKELFDARQLSFIHACGLSNGTRSHFEAMDMMERGVAETKFANLSTGWLTRYLDLAGPGGALPALAVTGSPPASLLGDVRGATFADPEGFNFWGGPHQRDAVAKMYAQHDDLLGRAGRRTLGLLDEVWRATRQDNGEVRPYEPKHGAAYPEGELGAALKGVARMIRADLGLNVAAVDFGGWDTHEGQEYRFGSLVEHLSQSLRAFTNDLQDQHHRLSVVVISEFGRRLKSNQSAGTDHGHGNVAMVLGGQIDGGKLISNWPGLNNDALDSRADLAVTTDYRQVLAEMLVRRAGVKRLGSIFPGLDRYQPIGIFRGEDAGATL